MSTALFVQRDTTHHPVLRRLRGSCTREEWDVPAWRQAAIARTGQQAIEQLRAEGLTFLAWAPVALRFDAQTHGLLWAEIDLPGQPVKFISPVGDPLLGRPADAPRGIMTVKTTYATWAEGPLMAIVPLDDEPTALPDDVTRVLAQSTRPLRERITAALGVTATSPQARKRADTLERVDFRLRGVFSRPDYTVLVSKQTGEDAKLLTADGVVDWFDEAEAAAAKEIPDETARPRQGL